MKARNPWTYLDGTTLEASRQAENYQLIATDLANLTARRYTYSSFELDWSGLTNASNASEFFYTFSAPWAYEIVGVELYAASAATGTATLAISGSVAGQENVVATFAGATTRAVGSGSFVAVTAVGAVTYTLSVSAAAYTLNSCKAVIHIRTDRLNAGDFFFPSDPNSPFTFGQAATSKATFDAVYSSFGLTVSGSAAATRKPTIQVFTTRAVAAGAVPASDLDLPIAALSYSRRVEKITVGLAGLTAGNTYVASVRDNTAASTLISVTGTVSGSSTTQSSTSTTLQATMGSSPTTDPVIRIDRGTGTAALALAYAVVFWD